MSEASGQCTVDTSRVALSAGVGSAVHDAAGTAWSCQPDSSSRQARRRIAASRAPTTRGVRSIPSADTSLRRRHSSRGHVDATHGEHGVVLDERTQRGRSGWLREQSRQGGGGEGGGLEERFGQAGVPRLFEDAHEVDVVETQPVGRGRHDECGRAELGEDRPAVGGKLGAGVFVGELERTERVDVALGIEHGAHAAAQRVLIVGEGEIHAQARGSPSRRSATTLRWISLVPA